MPVLEGLAKQFGGLVSLEGFKGLEGLEQKHIINRCLINLHINIQAQPGAIPGLDLEGLLGGQVGLELLEGEHSNHQSSITHCTSYSYSGRPVCDG